MIYIHKYGKFINEAVYLGKTPFNSYSFISDRNSNYGTLNIIMNDGEELVINIETLGSTSGISDTFMINTAHISHRSDLGEIVETIIKIMNKNQLGYKFSVEKISPSKYSKQIQYKLNTQKPINIKQLEQIFNTTKVVNKKVKDIDDWDKLIYQTL